MSGDALLGAFHHSGALFRIPGAGEHGADGVRASSPFLSQPLHQHVDTGSPPSPSVAVVIVTFHSARLLPDLFGSLPAAMAGSMISTALFQR